MAELSRRRLFGAGALAAGTAGLSLACSAPGPDSATAVIEPFHGAHQAGVATAPQDNVLFAALDLLPGHTTRAALTSIMKLWTEDASRLTQGAPALADTEPELALDPARLTVTVGFGPSLFEAVGLAAARPAALQTLPPFTVDRLQSQWSGGQLLLQICSDSPLAVSHAHRVLVKNVRSIAATRWVQRGYRTSHNDSMRNLMGQVDGTVNLNTANDLDRYVWDDGAGEPWFAGGTVLVLRRIRAEMDSWDELDRRSKELVVGRTLGTGAPLTGVRESDEPDFTAAVNGITVIPENAHIALARPHTEQEHFLRRPYNYDDPPPPGQTSDSGLLFAAYQRDPSVQFVPVQQRLSQFDAFNPWITPVGSAVFAILPGVAPGQYLGQVLLES